MSEDTVVVVPDSQKLKKPRRPRSDKGRARGLGALSHEALKAHGAALKEQMAAWLAEVDRRKADLGGM